MVVTGKLVPLKNKVIVTGMEFGEVVRKSGIVLTSDNGKSTGIHPRWGQVWAVGPDQHDVKVGEWVLMEHGRWTRGINYEHADGTPEVLHMIDLNAIILVSDAPSDHERTVMGALDLHV